MKSPVSVFEMLHEIRFFFLDHWREKRPAEQLREIVAALFLGAYLLARMQENKYFPSEILINIPKPYPVG